MSLEISASDVAALLPQVLDAPATEIKLLDWTCQPLSVGGSQAVAGGLGVYRVSGQARQGSSVLSWSLIVKAVSGSAGTGSDDPVAWNYWKREVLLYQSGLLDHLPGGISVPRCYAITEHAGDVFWLWLEEVHETHGGWTLERYQLAARHLGQFNGAYLSGHPLPKAEPWMTRGRTRQWFESSRLFAERSHLYADTPLAKRWFGRDGLERTMRLWARCEEILQAFEQLPACFCHHDAFRRNLLDRRRSDGRSETVAIDWAITGFGRVGEEAGVTAGISLMFLDVGARQAKALDQAVFNGYLEGLHDTGWRGEPRLVRLGYATNALVLLGICWNLAWLESAHAPEGIAALTSLAGHDFDEMVHAYAEVTPFLLDLGDEALTLAAELDGQLK